jgi:2-polyprenyl-3-methyl-5-hydroxy-6-metoxy-1,4-benzoquinol methylase
MNYEQRVPEELIKEGHYLGRPADLDDKIIKRRVELVKKFPGFCGRDLELLDIGCGNGASMFLLAPEMKFCLGVEIEATHLEEFKKYKEQLAIGNCSYVIKDIETEDLGSKFDRIISFEVIEHLKDDKNVRRFYEHLKEDGLMAISVPNSRCSLGIVFHSSRGSHDQFMSDLQMRVFIQKREFVSC